MVIILKAEDDQDEGEEKVLRHRTWIKQSMGF